MLLRAVLSEKTADSCHRLPLPGLYRVNLFLVEKILKGSLDSIPSPSPSNSNYGQESLLEVEKQNIAVCCKQKLLKNNSMLTSPSNVLPYYLKACFLVHIMNRVEQVLTF